MSEVQRRSARDVLIKIGPPAVGPLISALEEGEQQTNAADILGTIGDTRAVGPLITALTEDKSAVRLAAAKALGRIGDERAVPPLVTFLGVSRGEERRVAVAALGQIGDTRAIIPLVALLTEARSLQLRRAVAKALAKLEWQPSRDQTGALYWVMRREWERCAEIGAPAIEPLATALREKSKGTSAQAARALAEIGPPAVRALLLAMEDDQVNVRTHAAEALGWVGDRRAVEPLIAILEKRGGLGGKSKVTRDSLLSLRIAVVRALGQIGDARAVEPLFAALSDHYADVRAAAVSSLGEIEGPTTEALARALCDLGSRLDSVRKTAAEDLGKAGDVRALEPLGVVLRDSEWRVRASAATALGSIPHPRAVELLIGALDDAEHWPRRSAGQALVRLYREGGLDGGTQQAILAHRQRICQRHTDKHHENEKGCWSWHEDAGIGVDFPL
jgi:HEAT repeat protein